MAKSAGKISVARLAESLVLHGIDAGLAGTLAAGILSELQGFCWANLTDLVGTADAVDEICHSVLPPGSLAKMLTGCELLRISKGSILFLPSAYTERPLYIDMRWRREHPVMLRAAKSRAGMRKGRRDSRVVVPLPEPYRPDRPEKDRAEPERPKKEEPTEELIIGTNLFGEPIIDEKAAAKQRRKERRDERAKQKGVPGYAELVEYWFDEWGATEGRGVAKYPFKSIDGKCIKEILEVAEDFEHACSIINAYINCPNRFYAGKPLRKLAGDIARFIASAASSGHKGEIPYEDGIEGMSVFSPGEGVDEGGGRKAATG